MVLPHYGTTVEMSFISASIDRLARAEGEVTEKLQQIEARQNPWFQKYNKRAVCKLVSLPGGEEH